MGEHSKIEWTDHTFNPVIGCTKVSDGCKFCYAEEMMDKRYGKAKWGPGQTRVRTSAANWKEPYKWNNQAEVEGRRARVFCASLADVFEDHPDWEVPRIDLFRVIDETPWLDWLLLTKRPQNVMPFLRGILNESSFPSNVWIGTSVENQAAADERIPHLLGIPANVHFLSMEPLLGPVDLSMWVHDDLPEDDDGAPYPGKINWVIVGGESGHEARPMHPAWVRSIREQCQAAGAPFLFKQWGEYVPVSSDSPMPLRQVRSLLFMRPGGEILQGEDFITPGDVALWRAGKKVAGRLLDGVEWNQLPG